MMSINLQIEPFTPSGSNLSQLWKTWKSKFNIYLIALKYNKEDDDTQVALFLQVGGDEIRRRYDALEADKKGPKLEDILKVFDEYFGDYRNVTQASYVFWKMTQAPNESFDDFLLKIRLQAIECEFGEAEKRNLKDKIVHGIFDNNLREKLLREKKITLEAVIDNCKNAEIARCHAKSMQCVQPPVIPSNDEINVLKKHFQKKLGNYPNMMKQDKSDSNKKTVTCYNCGRPNHYASQCRAKRQARRNLNVMEFPECECAPEDYDDDSCVSGPSQEDEYCLSELHMDTIQNSSKWFERGFVNGNPTLLKLDTGACVNAISIQEVSKWNVVPKIIKCNTNVITYTKHSVEIIGECVMSCRVNNIEKNLKFLVTNVDTYPILSADACEDFGLIVRVKKQTRPCLNEVKSSNPGNTVSDICFDLKSELKKLLDEYQDIFDGMGRVQYQYKICIDESMKPHVSAPRKIPLSKEKQFKEELMKMEKNGIIQKVDKPTDWVNGITVVDKKDGSIRICLDPRPLNKAIQKNSL